MKKVISDRLEVVKGDITRLAVDCIVNAANRTLLGGGGVDGAIHRAAGPELLEACKTLGGCETGSAKITKGFRLPAKYVIHAVGPVWRDGRKGEDELLKSCYTKSLQLAEKHGCKTIAFPNISTGVYGFPKRRAAYNALEAVTSFLKTHELPEKVIFVCFDDENYNLYQELLEQGQQLTENDD
jgi:O-acetyl-ADP-ribose deacetylase (regulator of RNase III)